jgi:hypothetical protein
MLLKRLALPHFYSHPVILTGKALRGFSQKLVNDTALGSHLRHLFVWQVEDEGSDSDSDDEALEDNEALMDIIRRAPLLRRVYGVNMGDDDCVLGVVSGYAGFSVLEWRAFCLMAVTAGASLLEYENLPIYDPAELCSPNPFRSLTALRSLRWHCPAKFNVQEGSALKECFPSLTCLRINICNLSFLALLLHMEWVSHCLDISVDSLLILCDSLPVLSQFAYYHWEDKGIKNFLQRHGRKLHKLELRCTCSDFNIFQICPALTSLTVTLVGQFFSFSYDCTYDSP